MTQTLFEYDHILILSEYRTPDIHSHLASHLIVSPDQSLHCIVDGISFDTDALFIASDVLHTVYSDTGDMLVFLFDTTSAYSDEIEQNYLQGLKYKCLDDEQVISVRRLWTENAMCLDSIDKAVLDYFGLKRTPYYVTDERITKVLQAIREMDEIPENAVPLLCQKVYLSQSRLSHLFKEVTGISLSRYLAMEKMRKGYIHFQKHSNITEAAMCAGFDSPSHFAATCKRMFGISFSEFIKS